MAKNNDEQVQKNAKDIEELSKSFTELTQKTDAQFSTFKTQIKHELAEQFSSFKKQIEGEFAAMFTAFNLSTIPIVSSSGEMPHNSLRVLGPHLAMPSSADSCSRLADISLDNVVNKDEESSGLQDAELLKLERETSINDEFSAQIDSQKDTHKLLDELPEQILAASSSIDQVLGKNDYDSGILEIEDSIEDGYSDEMPNVIAKGGSDMVSFSPNTSPKVFEEMPNQFSIKPTEEIDGDKFYIPLIDFVPRVFDPGTSIGLYIHCALFQPSIRSIIAGQCISFSSFLGQCKSVISFTNTVMVFIFDPGGCGEPFRFWIEGVVGMLYCHLLECLVSCMWSHIISLVDERKMANTALKNGVVGSLVKSSKLLTELLMDYIFWIRGALNLDDVELVQMTFGIVPNMIQHGVGLKIVMDVGLHFQRSLVEFSQEGLSTLTNTKHWIYVGSGIIGFSYRKVVVQGVVYKSIQSYIPLLINPGKVFLFVLHRPDDEAEFGQTALVLNPSSMIEMCLVHFVPNFFYDSSTVMEIEKKLLLTKFKGRQDSRGYQKGTSCLRSWTKGLFTSLRTRMFFRVWERVYVVWKTWKRKSIEDCCNRCEALKNCSHELQ